MSHSPVDTQARKVIPYKEYVAQREAERRASPTSKSTSGEEEDWDEEPPLPPQGTPPGARLMAQSQEDEWKLMVNQDPRSGSVAGDSGHGTMTATGEDESVDNMEELVGVVGGADESVTTEHLLDVEWRDGDPLFVFDDDNVMKPQTLLPPQPLFEHVRKKTKLFPPLNCPESIAERLSKTAPTHLEPNYDDAELVGFTRSSLVNVIPWIKYEAQNMTEPSFRQELQCIREAEHLQYIIVMIVWF